MNLQILDEAFFQARLKVDRANRHIHEVQHWFDRYSETDFCRIIDDTDPQSGHQVLRAVADPMPADIPLTIGDALHCLSCSVDYVMSGMMRAKTGNATRIGFPTNETRHALRKSFMSPKGNICGRPKKAPPTRRIVENFPAVVLELFTVIKPYRGGNFALWEIRKADNIDKHNFIIPAITVATVEIRNLIDEVHNCSFGRITAEVYAGGRINVIGYAQRDGGRLKCEEKVKATATITFPDDAEVFAREPVLPTLLQCSQFTRAAIDHIERTVRARL